MRLPLIPVLLALACTHPGTLEGTARDALRGRGLPALTLTPDAASPDCPAVSVTPDVEGRFSVQGCADHAYTARMPEGPIVWQGLEGTVRAGQPAELTAWPTASEPGVYALSDTVSRLSPPIALEAAPVVPSRTVVRFPLEVPATLAQLRQGDHLLMQGDTTLRLTPLGRSTGTLTFERPAPPQQMGAWWFEGVDIAGDGAITPLPQPAPKAVTQRFGGQSVVWIAAADLPAGRYLVGGADRPRAWMLDVVAD